MAVVEEQDLFERIKEKVNRDFVRAFLAAIPNEHPEDVQLNANLPELIEQIKAAFGAGRVSREKVLGLLQEYEENGNQTVLYYSPISAAASQLCCTPEVVATKLFGSGWRAGFPRLIKLDNGWEVVDFRIGLRDKPTDWLMKIYTYQESRVQVRELQPQELQGLPVLRENEYAVIYKKQVTESVCLARWNDHPRHGLLELRVEISGRMARFEMDVNAIWSRLLGAFNRDDDFEPWELAKPLERILRECPQHQNRYQLGLAHLTDSGEGGVKYVPYTEHDTIDATPIRLQTINQILDDGGRCSRLTMTWLPELSGGAIEKKLRTYAGSRQSNELVISAQTTARAVDYVTNQLRYFAG